MFGTTLTPLTRVADSTLKSDKEILLDLAVALQRGRIAFDEDPKLQCCLHGPVNESRFMQRATHAMRLYLLQPFFWNEQDARLERFVRYLLNAHIPTRLYVKRHQDFTQALRILHFYVRRVVELKLPEADTDILLNSVTDNFAFYKETILLAMATDHRSCAN